MRHYSSISARTALGLSLTAAVALSSCGRLDHMQDNMDKTVAGLNNTENTTCKMYTSLRQGNAKVSRDSDMEAIRKGKNINEKLELAAKYMQGFEYQVWTTACADVAPREITIDQAATELLTAVQPYVKNRSKVIATKQSKDYETLYALAATLHRTNSLQMTYLNGTGVAPMRPLDILIQGLKLNQAKNRGTLTGPLPVWATTVGKYEKDAEFLLRLRANFLMAYGYAVADSDSYGDAPNTLEKFWRIVTTKLGVWDSWTPNLEKRDPTEIRERITVSLDLAKETRTALVDLGIDPMSDPTMVKIWKNADFSKFDLTKMKSGKGDSPARADAIQELISARDILLSRGAEGTW